MAALLPCTNCDRFVRNNETQCPFCNSELQPRVVKSGRRHVARAAMVALALGGCAESSPTPGDGGAIEVDSSTPADAGTGTDAVIEQDGELVGPLYGAPPPADAEVADDAELPAPAYGAIPVDAG